MTCFTNFNGKYQASAHALKKLDHLTWLFIILMLCNLIPIWCYKYLPFQDNSRFLHNALLLKDYWNYDNYMLRSSYGINPVISPYFLGFILLGALMLFFPPLIVDKLFVSAYMLFFPLSVLYFIRATGNQARMLPFIILAFSYNLFLFYGFYNFLLGSIFYFVAFGFWLKRRENFVRKDIFSVFTLWGLVYLSHIFSFALLIGSVLYYESARFVQAGSLKRKDVLTKVSLSIVLFISASVFLIQGVQKDISHVLHSVFHPGWGGLEFLLTMGILRFYTDYATVGPDVLVSGLMSLTLSGCLIATVVSIVRKKTFSGNQLIFGIISAGLFALYFKTSFDHMNFLKERILFMALLLSLPCVSIENKRFQKIGIVLVSLFCLLQAGKTFIQFGILNQEIKPLAELQKHFEQHSTFAFVPTDLHSEVLGNISPSPLQGLQLLEPRRDGTFASDVIDVDNLYGCYECPFRFNLLKQNSIKPNYYILQKTHDLSKYKPMLEHYRQVYDNDKYTIYEKEVFVQPIALVESPVRLRVGFVQKAGIRLIDPMQYYEPGLWGWVTRTNPSLLDLEEAPHFSYAITSKHDATMRIDIPNGRYFLKYYFKSTENESYNTYIRLNGLERLHFQYGAKDNGKVRTAGCTLTVTNQHILQTFHAGGFPWTPWHHQESGWLFSGVDVIRLQ